MNDHLKILVFIFLVTYILVHPSQVHADIAPPSEPPGANPEPGNKTTQVRMISEKVQIDIQQDATAEYMGVAIVSATFLMRNIGSEPESMAVRFPVGTGDERSNFPEITDISISVDGANVPLRRIIGEDPLGNSAEVPWIEFTAAFPVNIDVVINVGYTLIAAGEMPYIWFNYVFSTGAGWKGTIGSAELTVHFPYEVNDLNHIPGNENGFVRYTPGGIRAGNTIQWLYEDFEPTKNDIFSITIAAPSVWGQILTQKSIVTDNPQDGEAWGQLGKLYKSLLMSSHGGRGFRNYSLTDDPGAQELFKLSDQAYLNAVTLLPDDALWHAGYAELLGAYAYYAGFTGIDNIPFSIRALAEIQRALELDSNDAMIQDIAYIMEFYFPEGIHHNEGVYDFPWLTQTPLPTATLIDPMPLTELPVPLQTANPGTKEATNSLETQVSDAESKPKNSLPLCGGVLLLPILLIGASMARHRYSG